MQTNMPNLENVIVNSNVRSSVLFLGKNKTLNLQIGVDQIIDWSQKMSSFKNNSYDVICATLEDVDNSHFQELWQNLHDQNPAIKFILLIPEHILGSLILNCLQKYPVFRLSFVQNEKNLESDLMSAIEEARMSKQEIELEALVQEQNKSLKILYDDLEDRVQKRQSFLLEARRKTYIANARWESLREAMLAIYQAQSIGEMENNLLLALAPTLHLESLRVFLSPQDQVLLQKKKVAGPFSIFTTPLFRSEERIGSLVLMRQAQLSFSRDETDFFIRVAEAASLALDRLAKREQSLTLKEQWQATFNSVSDPIALINQNYELIQTNSSFWNRAANKAEATKTLGKKCYEILFNRESPCPQCHRGQNFRLENQTTKSIFEVSSQWIPLDTGEEKVTVNFYHDVTEQVRMERKILESVRLAEIGTIGSSIAHELNNPLGGILSFVQLLKMEMNPENTLWPDIQAMEDGVRRCQSIIENLLHFSRTPIVDEEAWLDLRDVIDRALKIVELQTKSRGIEIKIHHVGSDAFPFFAHMNLLTQAVRNLLQFSIEALIEVQNKMSQQTSSYHGVIEIHLEQKENEYHLRILDNSLGAESSPQVNLQLSLSIAWQIIHDYHGQLELLEQTRPFRQLKISLPRPVLQA
jgi:two-component system NtrC family sensor kinase